MSEDDEQHSPGAVAIRMDDKPSRAVERQMSQWLVSTEYLNEAPEDPDAVRLREELKLWLIRQVGLPKYYSAFVSNGYDSLRFISDIESERELTELGIVLKGHARRLLAEIGRLQLNEKDQGDDDVVVEKANE